MAGAEEGDLGLDICQFLAAVFKVDLGGLVVVVRLEMVLRTCLMATVSPVVRSMALKTFPKLPPVTV